MAAASTLRRLHYVVKTDNLSDLPQPESAPVKSENFSNSQTDVSLPERRVRGRFVLGRAEPAGYQLGSAAIMSIMHPAAPLDRSFQFQELHEREQVQAAAQRYLAARGMHF